MRFLRFSRNSFRAGQLINISKSEYHIYYRTDDIMLSNKFKLLKKLHLRLKISLKPEAIIHANLRNLYNWLIL